MSAVLNAGTRIVITDGPGSKKANPSVRRIFHAEHAQKSALGEEKFAFAERNVFIHRNSVGSSE